MGRKREEGKTAPTNNDDKPECGIHPLRYPLPFFRTKSVGPDFIGCGGIRKMELFHRAKFAARISDRQTHGSQEFIYLQR
jgi:hypothetical protein